MKFYSFNQLPLYTDDFFVRNLDQINKKDAIVIHNPVDAIVVTPALLRSRKTLQEHIVYIRDNHIKKAIIVAEDIAFLSECPSLEYLWVLPAISANNFDFSPIYELPNLKWLQCETIYGLGAMYDEVEKVKVSYVDYSRLPQIKRLIVNGANGHQNVHMLEHVESLLFTSGYPKAESLSGSVPGASLKNLSICQAPIRTLNGLEVAAQLQRLELLYNRRLTDISALCSLQETMACLEIDTCGKIADFSVLSELHNLEFLTLKGSNTIPNLSFLEHMPKLKYLHLTMNVLDGDLSLCARLPYVRIQNRKHYSHKNMDLPKNYTDPNKAYPSDEI